MQNDQLQLRNLVATDRQQVQSFDQRLRRIEDQVQTLHQTPGAPAPEADKLASIEDRLNRLEAAVTGLQASASASSSPLPSSVTSSGTGGTGESERTASLGSTPPAPSAPGAAAPAGASSLEADLDRELDAARKSSEPGGKIYREGLEAMKAAHYPAAIEKFGLFQKKYPKSELTEPGEYFSASAFFELGKYDQAILQFNDVVMRFPKGRFASAALLREAQAFVKLKDKIDARLTLQKLLSDHGDSPEAAMASNMMRDLERD